MNAKGGGKRTARIAIIEETADNIYSMKFILQSLGFQVQSISAQSDYLSDLLQSAPDLIVIDMMIPNGEAYPIIRRLRATNELQTVPILAITADAMQGTDGDVLAAGAADVLTKPYNVADLKQKLNQLLN